MAVYSCAGIYLIPAVVKIGKRDYLVRFTRIYPIINIWVLHFLPFFFGKMVCHYRAFAIIAAAGLDGIEKGLQVPAPIDEDIFHMTEERRAELGIENLPASLGAAIQEFENGTIGRKTLGDHVFGEYVAMKKAEWDSYRTAVHAWEVEQYQAKF